MDIKNLFCFLVIYLIIINSIFSFQGGNGTLENPYNISTCAELQNMSSNLSAHYQLVQNIDCSVPPFNTDPWFSPIGNCTGTCGGVEDNAFTGFFNGNNFKISDLIIVSSSNTGNYGWGLFGFISGAGNITNVSLENIFINVSDNQVGGLVGFSFFTTYANNLINGSVIGNNHVGGLIGYSFASSILNSSSSSSVNGNFSVGGLIGYSDLTTDIQNSSSTASIIGNNSVGGLVGSSINSNITNSSSSSSVNGNFSVGGLIGYSDSTPISNSYSTGPVSGYNLVGGLIGMFLDSFTQNSYSTGPVSGYNFVGGLVGGSLSSIIQNSYSTGSITGNNHVGGLVGNSDSTPISNSYSTGNINGNHSIGGLVGVSIYGSNITNSFTTSNVNGINSSSTGGLIGINDGDYFGFGPPTTITNSFYYNSTENPSRGIGFDDDGGIVTAESNLSYFYDNTNQPFNGNWDSNVWNFTGNNLPFFNGQENPFLGSSILNSQSISSLFPLGGLSISFLIILGFLLF